MKNNKEPVHVLIEVFVLCHQGVFIVHGRHLVVLYILPTVSTAVLI